VQALITDRPDAIVPLAREVQGVTGQDSR